MSNTLDEDLWGDQLATVSRAIESVRGTLSRLEDAREELVRRLEVQKFSRPEMVRLSGLSRGRIWQMVQHRIVGEEGYIDPESEIELIETVDEMYRQAADLWGEHDEVGTVDDYFPLEWKPCGAR